MASLLVGCDYDVFGFWLSDDGGIAYDDGGCPRHFALMGL